MSLLRCERLHEAIHSFDVRRAAEQCPGCRGWGSQRRSGCGISFERHEILVPGAKRATESEHPVVYGPRRIEIGVDGRRDGAHAVRGNATIVPGYQHRPLRQWQEDRVVHLELDRQIDCARRRHRNARHRCQRQGLEATACAAPTANRAARKLLGNRTWIELSGCPGARDACGSALQCVTRSGFSTSQTEASA